MEFNKLGITPIVIFNLIIWLFFTLAYFYQFVYMIRVWARGTVVLPPAKKQHTFAFFISAHNEEPVIGNLVRSILSQDYPRELIDCFVVCDACTDNTHEMAEQAPDLGALALVGIQEGGVELAVRLAADQVARFRAAGLEVLAAR